MTIFFKHTLDESGLNWSRELHTDRVFLNYSLGKMDTDNIVWRCITLVKNLPRARDFNTRKNENRKNDEWLIFSFDELGQSTHYYPVDTEYRTRWRFTEFTELLYSRKIIRKALLGPQYFTVRVCLFSWIKKKSQKYFARKTARKFQKRYFH